MSNIGCIEISSLDGTASTTQVTHNGNQIAGITAIRAEVLGPDGCWSAKLNFEMAPIRVAASLASCTAELDDHTAKVMRNLPSKFLVSLVSQILKEVSSREDVDALPDIAWMTNYMLEEEFPIEHAIALSRIVGLVNECEDSEKDILEFSANLYRKYVE